MTVPYALRRRPLPLPRCGLLRLLGPGDSVTWGLELTAGLSATPTPHRLLNETTFTTALAALQPALLIGDAVNGLAPPAPPRHKRDEEFLGACASWPGAFAVCVHAGALLGVTSLLARGPMAWAVGVAVAGTLPVMYALRLAYGSPLR